MGSNLWLTCCGACCFPSEAPSWIRSSRTLPGSAASGDPQPRGGSEPLQLARDPPGSSLSMQMRQEQMSHHLWGPHVPKCLTLFLSAAPVPAAPPTSSCTAPTPSQSPLCSLNELSYSSSISQFNFTGPLSPA